MKPKACQYCGAITHKLLQVMVPKISFMKWLCEDCIDVLLHEEAESDAQT